MNNSIEENTTIVSIIMPLYNAEKFLKEAITSILQQTFKQFELICIDDGSNDNTNNIVKDFQKMSAEYDYCITINDVEQPSQEIVAYGKQKGNI